MAGTKRKLPETPDEPAEQDRGSRPGSPRGHAVTSAATAAAGRPQLGRPNPSRPRPPPPGVSADGYFRRLYESEPDFTQLARQDARFAALYGPSLLLCSLSLITAPPSRNPLVVALSCLSPRLANELSN